MAERIENQVRTNDFNIYIILKDETDIKSIKELLSNDLSNNTKKREDFESFISHILNSLLFSPLNLTLKIILL